MVRCLFCVDNCIPFVLEMLQVVLLCGWVDGVVYVSMIQYFTVLPGPGEHSK
jgi:hypothetical protein